MQNMQQS